MQRRAAAVYLVLFVVLAGGAYAYIEVGTTQPEISIDGPTYEQGDTLSVDGRTYTVSTLEAEASSGGGGGHGGGGGGFTRVGELTWFNDSNIASATIENDSTIEYQGTYRVSIADDASRSFTLANVDNASDSLDLYVGERLQYLPENATTTIDSVDASGVTLTWSNSTTLSNNSTVSYQDGSYRLVTSNASESFTLLNDGNGTAAVNGTTFAVGDSYEYQPPNTSTTIDATVESVTSSNATLGWSFSETLTDGQEITFRDQYTTLIANDSNASSLTLTRQRNLTNVLEGDQRVENETLMRGDTEYVRFTDNSTQPLDEYIDAPYTKTLVLNDTFFYLSENTTVEVSSIEPAAVSVTWPSPESQTVEFSQHANVTLNGQGYFIHFESNSSVQVLPASEYYGEFRSDQTDINAFDQRINGLWGIVILSLLASIVLIAAAYLPNKS
jgi:hypothetical protein